MDGREETATVVLGSLDVAGIKLPSLGSGGSGWVGGGSLGCCGRGSSISGGGGGVAEGDLGPPASVRRFLLSKLS